MDSLIEYFYAIPGVPSKALNPEQLNSGLQHHKIFIQSTSQGSRCLKRGTRVLYLKEVLCTYTVESRNYAPPPSPLGMLALGKTGEGGLMHEDGHNCGILWYWHEIYKHRSNSVPYDVSLFTEMNVIEPQER